MIQRRSLLAMGIASSTSFAADKSSSLDSTLRSGIAARGIPAAVAMVATSSQTLYSGAFGTRDRSGVPVQTDSIFQVMSMTKAVTTVAALQLVEQGKLQLDAPVSSVLPAFEKVQVLTGFDGEGKPLLRRPARPVTLHHLLTHTCGLGYDIWNGELLRHNAISPESITAPAPLLFDPGERWHYGRGIDWAGRMVETISGLTLEEYFQRNILRPLGMIDTSYILPPAKFERLVSNYRRGADGKLSQEERKQPAPPAGFNGGGGLFSTAADYVRFMQMILRDGAGEGKVRILRPESVARMKRNQIGSLAAGKLKSYRPNLSADVDIPPGQNGEWTYGFLRNPQPYPNGGRSQGSLAWAGLLNTFYWIDVERGLCATLLMQFLPFVDRQATGLLGDFERAVYTAGF